MVKNYDYPWGKWGNLEFVVPTPTEDGQLCLSCLASGLVETDSETLKRLVFVLLPVVWNTIRVSQGMEPLAMSLPKAEGVHGAASTQLALAVEAICALGNVCLHSSRDSHDGVTYQQRGSGTLKEGPPRG